MIKEITLHKLLFALLWLLTAVVMRAQEACEYTPSAKNLKLLEKAADNKKYNSDERFDYYLEALDEEDNCLPCLMELGEASFKRSKRNGTSFQGAEAYLEQLIAQCPEYHSSPYYYLGAIHYANQDYELALEYFNFFLRFPDDDPAKFEKNYQQKYDEVKEALPSVTFYRDFYSNSEAYEPLKVSGVCSPVDDYLPALSPDGEIMFYTRKLEKKSLGDYFPRQVEEFTWSRREGINEDFDSGEPLPLPFNVGDNYGGATISVDNKEMIIAKKNPVQGNLENVDLFSTRFELSTDPKTGESLYRWSELEPLSENVNTTSGWEAQPSLSGDGQRLFFAKVGEGCKTDANGNFSHDLFVSLRLADGSWGKASPILGNINTRGQEKSPYMHSDSKTLYFASDGHLGGGGMDIFFCKMKDDGSFEDPKNMGHPINTFDDESGLIVSSDGAEAYFFSRKLKGSQGFDIYAFRLPEKAKPEKVIILKGQLTDNEGQPAKGSRIEISHSQSKTVQEIKVDEDDGKYAAVVNVPQNENVIMTVKGDKVAFNARLIVKENEDTPPAVVKVAVEVEEIRMKKAFIINDIYYETNKATIDSMSMPILDAFVDYLLEHPNIHVEIRGHTDNIGSDEANMALSMDRAFEVLKFLAFNGVPGNRLKAQGFGESKPLQSNESPEGRARNRRTEFIVTKM